MSGLGLKLRPASPDVELSDAELEAFAARPASPTSPTELDLEGPVCLGSDDDGATLVFVPTPAPTVPLRARAEPAEAGFRFIDRLHGELRFGTGPRNTVAVAVSVPLMLASVVAQAAPPSLPAEGATERGEVDRPVADQAAPASTLATDPTPAPATAISAPVAQLDLTGESLWAGLAGHRVRLEVSTADGGSAEVEGEVVAQSAEQVALAVGEAGTLASVDKAAVRSVLVDPPVAGATRGKDGAGLLIGGGVVVGIGVPLIVLGIAYGAAGGYYSSPDLGLGLGISGALLTAGAIPMIIFGAKRQREHRRAFGYAQVAPNVRVGKDGAVGGVRLRF